MNTRKLGAKKTFTAKDRKWDARVRYQAGLRIRTEEFSVYATSVKTAINKAMNMIGLSAIDADVSAA